MNLHPIYIILHTFIRILNVRAYIIIIMHLIKWPNLNSNLTLELSKKKNFIFDSNPVVN